MGLTRGSEDALVMAADALLARRFQEEPRGSLLHTTLTVEFDLVAAEDSSKHTICAIGEGMDRGDKSINKAMTAAYKYAMFELFCIPTEGDDADGDFHEVSGKSCAITDKDRTAADDFASAYFD